MNENKPVNLQLEIDRLVGGELDKSGKRKLVELLDSVPDGWRCCALAYMEADSWKTAIGSLLAGGESDALDIRDAELAINRMPPGEKRKRRMSSGTGIRSLVALAVIAAFVAGIGVSIAWNRSAVVDHPANLAAEPATGDSDPLRRKPAGNDAPNQQLPRELVGLVSVSNNGVTETAFAVIGNDDVDGPPPQFSRPPIADYVRLVWQRKGFAIEQHRKVVSVKLASGGRFDFPIDWVQYRPIGQKVF